MIQSTTHHYDKNKDELSDLSKLTISVLIYAHKLHQIALTARLTH